jgi:hypothetical protein
MHLQLLIVISLLLRGGGDPWLIFNTYTLVHALFEETYLSKRTKAKSFCELLHSQARIAGGAAASVTSPLTRHKHTHARTHTHTHSYKNTRVRN